MCAGKVPASPAPARGHMSSDAHHSLSVVTPANLPPLNADETLLSLDRPGQRYLTRSVSVAALVVYAAYLVYRAAFTLNPDAKVFSLLVYFAELHGFVSLFLYFHQLWHRRGRRVVPAAPGPKVDVFVTTYNEDVDLLRQTLRAAVAMHYPPRTYVLDDGHSQTSWVATM